MKSKAFVISAVASLVVGWGLADDALAQRTVQPSQNAVREDLPAERTFIVENLGSGVAADVYRVTCTAECIRADVNDTGPFNDTRFKVTIVGSSANFVGNASAISPAGGLSLRAEVCSGSNVNAARRAYITYTEVNAPGAENYDTVILCRLANLNNVNPAFVNPSVVKILDQ